MPLKKYSRNDLTKILAFAALFVAGLIWLLSAILGRDNAVVPLLIIIKDVSLLAAIAIPAYSFVNPMGKTWRVIYYILLAVAIVSLIFGSGII